VSKVEKTLDRVLRGNADANIRFDDLRTLLTHLGFVERVRGGHHIFSREGVAEILNLQPRGGKAKAYQVKQVRAVIISYRLAGEPEAQDQTGEEPGPAAGEANDGG
jgi:hypothetical protein